ncbi:MAG TPA: glutaredoxin domain-containing protein [Bacillales bacterium]|nr:glutaredoxin domain-containing protein [Bacillales bacterium]
MPKPNVTLYTQPHCPPCKLVKGFLSDHNVDYVTKDVAQDSEARDELMNQYKSMSTPTVVVGDEVVIGFELEKLSKLLNL